MTDFELNLTGSVNEQDFQEALDNYNSTHMVEFALSGSGQDYTLVGGDDVYCEGDLMRVAYFWEGYVSGQIDGDTSLEEVGSDG